MSLEEALRHLPSFVSQDLIRLSECKDITQFSLPINSEQCGLANVIAMHSISLLAEQMILGP